MPPDLAQLPDDVDALHRLVRDLAGQMEADRTRLVEAQGEIDRLRFLLRQLQRAQFGRRSERMNGDQLQLGLEDVDADIARLEAPLGTPAITGDASTQGRRLRALPGHLPREEVTCNVGHEHCPTCGGALHEVGESVSEMLDWVPAQLRVIRIRRPKYGCRACGSIHQAPAPERPIARAWPHPASSPMCW